MRVGGLWRRRAQSTPPPSQASGVQEHTPTALLKSIPEAAEVIQNLSHCLHSLSTAALLGSLFFEFTVEC